MAVIIRLKKQNPLQEIHRFFVCSFFCFNLLHIIRNPIDTSRTFTIIINNMCISVTNTVLSFASSFASSLNATCLRVSCIPQINVLSKLNFTGNGYVFKFVVFKISEALQLGYIKKQCKQSQYCKCSNILRIRYVTVIQS